MAKTREDFLKPIPLKTVEVETDELGIVRMKQLSGSKVTELQNWRRPNGKLDESKNWLYKLIVMSIVDDEDNVILTEEDIETIGGYPQTLVNRLQVAAAELNGFMESEDQPKPELLGKSDS